MAFLCSCDRLHIITAVYSAFEPYVSFFSLPTKFIFLIFKITSVSRINFLSKSLFYVCLIKV